MRKIVIVLCLSLLAFHTNAQRIRGIVASGATVEALAGGFVALKGSAADRQGNVYFSDYPNDIVHIWTIDGKLEKFGCFGGVWGVHFDRDGSLLICLRQHHQLWNAGMDGSHTVLADSFNGKPLNGPDDVWVNPKTGGVYFTDPPHSSRPQLMQQERHYLYFIKPNCKTVVIADRELVNPTGIVGAPNGKKLYVADFVGISRVNKLYDEEIVENKIYVYDIMPDGTLANKKLFASRDSDGMTIDRKGNVYLTGRGVTVYNSKGKQIMIIPMHGRTTDVTFGGKNRKTLFITTPQSLFSLKMRVRGGK